MQAGLRMIRDAILPAKIDAARLRWVDEHDYSRSQQSARPIGVIANKTSRDITLLGICSFYLHVTTS
jgi:hypothetical protein